MARRRTQRLGLGLQDERLPLLTRNVNLNSQLFRCGHADEEPSSSGKRGKSKGGKSGGAGAGGKGRGHGHDGGPRGGSAEACELDWESTDMSGFRPLDIIVATDCVFNELVVPAMVNAMHLLARDAARAADDEDGQAGGHVLVLNCMEIRCAEVHEVFVDACLEHFHVWRLPRSACPPDYDHPRVVIYAMLLRPLT